MNILDSVAQDYLKKDVPAFNVGDQVKVHVKIKEGARERIQIFEGFVLKKQNGGIGATFTVRKIASGVGVEKTFPIHSPWVEKIDFTTCVAEPVRLLRLRLNNNGQRTSAWMSFLLTVVLKLKEGQDVTTKYKLVSGSYEEDERVNHKQSQAS